MGSAEGAGLLGHADVQTTMLYVHHQPKTADAAALSEVIEARLVGETVERPLEPRDA